MNPDAVNNPLARRHTHKPNGSADEAMCPYCGQPISRKEFKEIRARIEAEERARIAKVEQSLKERFAREKALAEAGAKAAIGKAKRDAAKAAEAQIRLVRAKVDETISQ